MLGTACVGAKYENLHDNSDDGKKSKVNNDSPGAEIVRRMEAPPFFTIPWLIFLEIVLILAPDL